MMGQARLREFLEAQDMTLTEFARRIERSVPLVSMLTNDPDHTPSLDTALRIETATAGAVLASCWVKPPSSRKASPRGTRKRKSTGRGRNVRSAPKSPAIARRSGATR
jgi:transcriptional regulator with XRE-family HTH domain